MSFLTKSEIRSLGTTIFGDRFEEHGLNQASYDMRLGAEYYLVGDSSPKRLTDADPYLCLSPGQFALLATLETVKIPAEFVAFISVRTQFKLQGLMNISGFHVDPTFEGSLQFAVQNVSSNDIRLKLKQPTFTIFFSRLSAGDVGEPRKPDGEGISLRHVQMFGGNSVTVTSLHKEVDRLRTMVTIYGGIAAAALVALIVKVLMN